jgi:hypothetical protein
VRATTISGPPTLPESLRDDWQRLTAPTTAATLFTQDLLDGLPEPARRWLRHAVAPGTPLRRAAVLRQHGEIKVGRWLRYEADWVLAPPEGFIWAATSHFGPLFIRGFDRYTRGTGQLRWRIFGRIPFLSVAGRDVSRSAMGRLAGELCFVPAAALSPAVRWEPLDDRRAVACVDAHGWTHRVTLTVAESGRLERVDLPRWGQPRRQEVSRAPLYRPPGRPGGNLRRVHHPNPLPRRMVALPGPLRRRGVHPVHPRPRHLPVTRGP